MGCSIFVVKLMLECCDFWRAVDRWSQNIRPSLIALVQYTANVVTVSIFDALSIGSGLVAAVVLCIKRGN